ncbi:hypothetical protein N665_0164s0031 [Sinapis alba]|nr:hypothetical protein N665_0164s0031 [Sinapis alba]
MSEKLGFSIEENRQCEFWFPHSSSVWIFFSSRLGITSPSPSWDDVVQSLLFHQGSKHCKYLTILAWQASIYVIWWERNDHLHRGSHQSSDLTITKVTSIIKNRISALRPENKHLASKLIQLWFSKFP